MSGSILERIEAHQLKIIEGQGVIVAAVGGLVARVDAHDERFDRLERRMRWFWVVLPVACAVSAVAGAWVALRF